MFNRILTPQGEHSGGPGQLRSAKILSLTGGGLGERLKLFSEISSGLVILKAWPRDPGGS